MSHEHTFVPLQLLHDLRRGPRTALVVACACGGIKEVPTFTVEAGRDA